MLFQAFPYFPDNQPEMYSASDRWTQGTLHLTGGHRVWLLAANNIFAPKSNSFLNQVKLLSSS